MTPSLTSLADHVIWPSPPRPPVTSSPCSPLLPEAGRCHACPRPPTSPPLCRCPSSRSGTSLGANGWARDVTEGCDVTEDMILLTRSDIRTGWRETHHSDIAPRCCCDNPKHSTAGDTTTTTTGIPDGQNTHMGCVRRSPDASVGRTDRWGDCRCQNCVCHPCHCHHADTPCDSDTKLSGSVSNTPVKSAFCHRLCCQFHGHGVCDVTDKVTTARVADSASTPHVPRTVSPPCDCGVVNKSHHHRHSTTSFNNGVNKTRDTVNSGSEDDRDTAVICRDTVIICRDNDHVNHHPPTPLLNDLCHTHSPPPDSPDTGTDSACACPDTVSCHSDNNHRLPRSGKGEERQAAESCDCRNWAGMAPGLVVEWCRRCVKLPVAVVLFLLLLLLRRKGRRREVVQVPQVLLLLCLLLSRGLASPWIEEGAHSVKLRARFCQPVPQRHLRNMLGEAFDPDRMSGDDPFAGDKRGGGVEPSQHLGAERAALGAYYYPPESVDDLVDMVRNREEEEEEGWLREEGRDKEDLVEEVVKRKDIMADEEEGGGFFREENPRSRTNPKFNAAAYSPSHQPYLNMKRRKRQAEPGLPSPAFSNKDKKDSDPMLHLRLLLGSRNRKLRRKLKKEFRKKARKLARKPPPWTCSVSKVWGRLKDGFFPRYLLDGRCLTDKCFYRLYDCVPQRYRIKLLKRDPGYCNPLPTLGLNATYEQRWSVVRYYVTVGCNCQTADPLKVPLPFQGHITRS